MEETNLRNNLLPEDTYVIPEVVKEIVARAGKQIATVCRSQEDAERAVEKLRADKSDAEVCNPVIKNLMDITELQMTYNNAYIDYDLIAPGSAQTTKNDHETDELQNQGGNEITQIRPGTNSGRFHSTRIIRRQKKKVIKPLCPPLRPAKLRIDNPIEVPTIADNSSTIKENKILDNIEINKENTKNERKTDVEIHNILSTSDKTITEENISQNSISNSSLPKDTTSIQITNEAPPTMMKQTSTFKYSSDSQPLSHNNIARSCPTSKYLQCNNNENFHTN